MYINNANQLLMCLILSNVSLSLLGQGQPHTFMETRYSADCAGLASCAILNCPDLPCSSEEEVNGSWRQCIRQECFRSVDPIDNKVTIACQYNCIDTPFPLELRMLILLTSAAYGMLPGLCHAMFKVDDGKSLLYHLPLKRMCGWGCVGLLWGMNRMLVPESVSVEKMMQAVGVPLALSAAHEFYAAMRGK